MVALLDLTSIDKSIRLTSAHLKLMGHNNSNRPNPNIRTFEHWKEVYDQIVDYLNQIPQCHPFVKWAGGKTQLLLQLEKYSRLHNSIRYFEPFLGGGASFTASSSYYHIGLRIRRPITKGLLRPYSFCC